MNRNFFWLIFITVLSVIFTECSLFEPRDSFEEPVSDNTVDMKWISAILECPQNSIDNNIKFTDYLVTELFTSDFEYSDVNDPAEKIYSKESFVNRINNLGTPESVDWQDAGTCTNRGGDTIMIRDAKYAIAFSDGTQIGGTSDFNIVNQDKYRIAKWINYPSGSSTSYLTPIDE